MALNRLCLDTSAYSELARGVPSAVELVSQAAWVGVPAIAIGELCSGFLRGTRSDRNFLLLEEFLGAPSVSVIPVDGDVPRIYGSIHAGLKAAGRPIPTNDIWIAACAIASGAALVTFDRDFESVSQLHLILLQRP